MNGKIDHMATLVRELMLLFSLSVMSCSLQPHGLQHTRLPCPSPPPGAWPNSHPFSWWCHPIILSSFVPFSYPQSFPASESFPMSWIFASGGQNIGASASVLHFLPLPHFVWISESQRKCWVTIGNSGHFCLVLIFWNAFGIWPIRMIWTTDFW